MGYCQITCPPEGSIFQVIAIISALVIDSELIRVHPAGTRVYGNRPDALAWGNVGTYADDDVSGGRRGSREGFVAGRK